MPGGRGGRGGGRGNLSRNIQISKQISWLLRHGAEKEGLKLGEGGYVNVADVLNTNHLKSKKITFTELRKVVAENDKQRFSLIPISSFQQPSTTIPSDDAATATASNASSVLPDGDAGSETLPTSDDPRDYLIRANQGHSLTVATEGLYEPVTLENAPAMCVHGTTHNAWPLILKSGGLKRMKRTHVHFASGLPQGMSMLPEDYDADAQENENGALMRPQDAPVISGMRASSAIVIYLDLPAALSSGLQFFRSENGVLLCAGEAESGLIPYKFFRRVEERQRGLGILMKNGELVKDLHKPHKGPKQKKND
ncbi:MAG: hypothetical protein Q9165_003734 [Trypethelium subeluteriae]